jgi:hypothetical protein
MDTASDPRFARSPNSQPLGSNTGAPPRTQLSQQLVTPRVNATGVVQAATVLVPATAGNRFVTLTAPLNNFSIFVNGEANFNVLSSHRLPAGLPFEIALPGNQALYAVTDAPTYQSVQIIIAEAISSESERRL